MVPLLLGRAVLDGAVGEPRLALHDVPPARSSAGGAHRYKPPPRKRKAVALEMPAITPGKGRRQGASQDAPTDEKGAAPVIVRTKSRRASICWQGGTADRHRGRVQPAGAADRAAGRVMLPRVQPIAPIRRPEPFDDPEWVFDFKYDGFRCISYLEQGRCRMISRNGNLMSRFAGLGDQVASSLDVDDAIIDGEVFAPDETGRPQFYDLLRGTRAPAYVAFDLIWLNGADLRALPLTERRRQLQTILPVGSVIISEVLSVAAGVTNFSS
jgi:ATP-dependent DNA ligase